MTLIVWFKWLKRIHIRVERLETYLMSANFMEQFTYSRVWFNEYFERAVAKIVSHYSVLPTYAPFVSYAGLGNVNLYYKPQSSEEYLTSTSALLFRTLRMSAFYLDGLRIQGGSGGLSAKLTIEDEYLYIGEETAIPHRIIMPTLLPTLTL